MRVARPAELCSSPEINELHPYTLGHAPHGTRCAYLGYAVDARDVIFGGVVYMFTYDRRGSLDTYFGVVKSIDHTGDLFGAVNGILHSVGDTVFIEWKRLLKIREEIVFEDLKSSWQDFGGRSMKKSEFMPLGAKTE